MKAWEERLSEQVKREWENYKKKRINLDTAHTDLRLDLAGSMLYVESVSGGGVTIDVKLNRNTNPALTLNNQTKILTVFTTLYLSWEAQADQWIDLIIGCDFDKIDMTEEDRAAAQPILQITHANPDTNQAGANNTCKKCLIQADPQNSGLAWIDFTQAAVQNDCIALAPGDYITVTISNTNLINANFEIGNDSVWIIIE